MATYNGHNEDSSGNILLSIGNGMTATVETGTTASQAYTKGSYLFFNNRLCKATSAISSGATLAIGTNLSQTSIGQEITSHLRSSDGKEFYFDVKDGTYGYYPSASKTASEFVPFGGTSDSGMATLSTTQTTKVTLGYKPKFLALITYKSDTNAYWVVYNEDCSTKQFDGVTHGSSNSAGINPIPSTANGVPNLVSIDSDGFTVNYLNSSSLSYYGTSCYWFAKK